MDVLEMRRRVAEPQIAALVDRFYDRVRDDSLLGPVFATRIEPRAWPRHLATMRSFWSTVLIGTGTYRGDPMVAHQAIEGIDRGHFTQWLALFETVVREEFADEIGDAIMQRARRMGDRLTASMGL